MHGLSGRGGGLPGNMEAPLPTRLYCNDTMYLYGIGKSIEGFFKFDIKNQSLVSYNVNGIDYFFLLFIIALTLLRA